MSKLTIIILYRDRVDELQRYLTHINTLKCSLSFELDIIIVEQNGILPFNKGALVNIGLQNAKSDWICINDVDTLPVKASSFKAVKDNSIVQPYGHKHTLSNIFFTTKNTMIDINGFSNRYWGWEYEDTDVLYRAIVKKVNIDRSSFNSRYMSEEYVESYQQTDQELSEKMNSLHAKVNSIIFEYHVLNPSVLFQDGITTLNYNIEKLDKKDEITHLYCNLELNYEYQDNINKYNNRLKLITC